jgi:hypothetical protein
MALVRKTAHSAVQAQKLIRIDHSSLGAAFMNRKVLRLAVVAVTVATAAACAQKDVNAITGSTSYDSVSLSSNPSSFDLHVRFVPTQITVDSSASPVKTDTVPAHYVPADSTAFNPIATIEPQGVAIANGAANMTFTFSDSKVAEINGSFFIQPDTIGTTNVTIVYTDVNHNFATTSLTLPITVTEEAP